MKSAGQRFSNARVFCSSPSWLNIHTRDARQSVNRHDSHEKILFLTGNVGRTRGNQNQSQERKM
jgi:hypothetical protein